jgi:hypothetical protein
MTMKAEHVVCKASYLNYRVKGLTYELAEAGRLKTLLREYKRLRDEISERDANDIVAEIRRDYPDYPKQADETQKLVGQYALLKKVDPSKLCFDKNHEEFIEHKGEYVTRGMMVSDYVSKHSHDPDFRKKLQFIENHFDFFNSYVPIIIKPYGEKFEIVEGNHRTMTAILGGEKVLALEIVPKGTPNIQKDLNFSYI